MLFRSTYVDVPYTTAQPISGLQGFFVSFVSDVDTVDCGRIVPTGAVGNQVFVDPATGSPFPFTQPVGYYEMYHLLKIDPTVTRPAPSASSLLNYQVCAFRHLPGSAQPPHGVLLIWPEIEIQPAILPTTPNNNNPK